MSHATHQSHNAAVEALVQSADFEIIPFKSAAEKLPLVPPGATITVTCSAKLGLDRTLDFTASAVNAGYRVVPHLAARQITDEAYLRKFIGRLDELGVTDLYVIGGDAPEPAGNYNSAAEVIEALSDIEHGIQTIGVACYPEGHPSISDATLFETLRREQPHADYMVSQLCFSSGSITSWLDKVRAEGIALPLHLGVAAPMQVRKLATISLQIGVGSSVRYLTKQHGFVGNLLRGSSYRPEDLLYEMGDALSDTDAGIERLHLFTFNQISETVDWQAAISGVAAGV
jgi:methylenetetrahydrofolate reductase (NADPH)